MIKSGKYKNQYDMAAALALSSRSLRKEVNFLRMIYPILINKDGGYYISRRRKDINDTIKILKADIKTKQTTVKNLRAFAR
jgi:hypothetical protein